MDAMPQASLRSLVLLAMLVFAAPAWAQQGALAVPRNLQQLTERAAVIVRGNVVSAYVEKHPQFTGLHTVVVTLHVRETLKGLAQPTFTFRQYVWDIRSRMGYTDYRKGDDMLLLMIAPNQYGLSSPAGMDQGRFRIMRDAGGREVALNGHGNAALFEGMTDVAVRPGATLAPASLRLLRTRPAGPIEAASLLGLIRDLVNGGG
jgi:hypothetical protein